MLLMDGEIFPTINVKVLPVKDSCKSLVNLDSRNAGTPLDLVEDRFDITFPKVVKDWLIFFNYWKCYPLIYYVLLTF